ncbi:MAG TPA: TrbG/VirB9 family P-type conjugative transfer protein [Allosphingosinicella sp.]
MRAGPILLAALIALPAPLAAQVEPSAAAGDPRIQTVAYNADQIVLLQGAPGYVITVEFGADEQVESVAVGDSGAWQVTPNRRGDYLFVKPVQAVSTNMTVVTSSRTYLFELAPLYSPSPQMAYTVRFSYPGGGAESVADEAATAESQGTYRLSGDRALRPSRIADDGRHTYIEWPRDRTLPAVYAIDPEGRESLVNGAMRDDLFVIDSVAPTLIFRIDQHVARAERVRRKKGS